MGHCGPGEGIKSFIILMNRLLLLIINLFDYVNSTEH
jgi:hypothetical protein